MSERLPIYRLYGTTTNIAVSVGAAAVFAIRGLLSAAGTRSLSGTPWTVVDWVLTAAFLIRCFDRVVVTQRGVTVYRIGIPRRVAAARLHRFQVVDKSSKWSRLYAETVDGKQIAIDSEWRTPDGQTRMRALWDHVHTLLEPQFRPPNAEAVTHSMGYSSLPNAFTLELMQRQGNSLASIARRYGVTEDEIRRATESGESSTASE